MFLWATPIGQKAFGRTAEEQESTKVLAANQGLYNGFLAAGLVWSLVGSEVLAIPIRTFFLGCVLVAGSTAGRPPRRRSCSSRRCPRRSRSPSRSRSGERDGSLLSRCLTPNLAGFADLTDVDRCQTRQMRHRPHQITRTRPTSIDVKRDK
jgi:hypothetical protein